MKHLQATMLSALLLVSTAAIAQSQETQKPAEPKVNAADTRPAQSDRGQQVFAQNCSRCHNSPEGFSPRISGTIARHMRVRAGLSDEDYKALRHFLNP